MKPVSSWRSNRSSSAGTIDTVIWQDDDWTVTIADGSLSAQWHPVAVHSAVSVLTAPDGELPGSRRSELPPFHP